MSHSVNTDIIPWIKRRVFYFDDHVEVINDPTLSTLLMPESVLYKECDWQTDDDEPEFKLRGWFCVEPETASRIGKDSRLAGHAWAKYKSPGTRVYILNESQYSNAGVFDISVVSDFEKYIEEFANDFSDLFTAHNKVEGPNAIAHWWA